MYLISVLSKIFTPSITILFVAPLAKYEYLDNNKKQELKYSLENNIKSNIIV